MTRFDRWLDPVPLLMLPLVSTGAWWILSDDSVKQLVGAGKVDNSWYLVLVVLSTCISVCAALIGRSLGGAPARLAPTSVLVRLMVGSALGAAVGTFAIIGPVLLGNAGLMVDSISGDGLATIAIKYEVAHRGATLGSLSQLGIVGAAAAGIVLTSSAVSNRLRRLAWGCVIGLVVMSTLRAMILAERLAVFEVLVPLLLLFASRKADGRPRKVSAAQLVRWVVSGVFAIVSLFVMAERNRSYLFVQSTSDVGAVEYGLERLAAYYVSAVNNGALAIKASEGLTLRFVLNPIRELAGVEAIADETYAAALRDFANPSLTNQSMVGDLASDGGWPLMLVLTALVGLAAGFFYVRYRAGSTLGLMVFPLIVLGLLEAPRIPYLFDRRVFLPFVVFSALWISSQHWARSDPLP